MTTAPSDSGSGAAAARLPGRIAFIGFGLIGGSIAMALRAAGATSHLVAWTPAGNGPNEGLRRGILDAAPRNAAAALEGADLVILAGPPMSVLDHLDHLGGPLRARLAPGATITDVASTKGLIVGRAEDLGLPFVGGHPMAGRETTGVGAATADLFADRPWVVVAADETAGSHIDRVDALARACGANPIRMSAIDHDLAVGAISHLPLVAAAALVESVAGDPDGWAAARAFAAGGWRDMTRLARGDPEMGGDILATNARPVAGALRAYRDAIDAWIVELERLSDESHPAMPERADAARFRNRLESAKENLEREPGA